MTNRVHAGVPTGGQFAATYRAESTVGLLERPAGRTQPQLAELADGGFEDRLEVARYAGTSHAIISKLALDEDDEVAIAAQASPAFTARDIETVFAKREYYREGVLANPNIGNVKPEVLEDLVVEGWEAERVVAAGNPNLPADHLDRLADDQSWVVRSTVAANPATSADVVDRLAADDDADVRMAASTRLNAAEDAA